MTLAVAKRTAELEAVKLRGLYWWPGRWLGSSAYREMTLAQQAAYRNLLDAAFLGGGSVPDDDRILAKASGDPILWRKLRAVVLKWFYRDGDTWRNETLDAVMEQTQRRVTNQRNYRERMNGNGHTRKRR